MSDQRWERQNEDSHVSQSGAEVLVDVGFQDRVEVLEFDVANESDYKNLVTNKTGGKLNQSLPEFREHL